MPKCLNLKGKRFNRLTVLNKDRIDIYGSVMWKCKCDCGNIIKTRGSNLKSGHTKSCGCIQKEKVALTGYKNKTHGYSRKNKTITIKIYRVWCDMISRCTLRSNTSYKYYGGRGIKVCDRWKNSFESFLEDMGIPMQGLSIDRIDNNGNYDPYNCRWATSKEQNRNNRNCKLSMNEVMLIKYQIINSTDSPICIAKQYNVSLSTIYNIKNGKTWTDVKLPEPSPGKIKELIEELEKFTTVKLKPNLKRLTPELFK